MFVIRTPIPIVIHPSFWLMAGIIGWLYAQGKGIIWIFIWMGIVFGSVLFHELGHALTARCFRQKAAIQLVFLGGLTSYDGPKLSFLRQFLVVLNGPLFGLLLAAGAYGMEGRVESVVWRTILSFTWRANVFWSIANLLPILPLDGGQLLRIVLEGFFGVRGFRAALLLGALFAVILSFAAFALGQFILGALLFLFAFQGYDAWRKTRYVTSDDREESLKQILLRAETAFQEGRKEEAKQLFGEIRQQSHQGMLADAASQYLAFLILEEGQRDAAYEILLPIADHLSEDARCLLHQLAAERKNFPLVAKLSTESYQKAPSQQAALNNARAFASLNQPEPAGGWLQTAWQYGGLDLEILLQEEEFAPLLKNKTFQEFIDPLKKPSP